MPAATLEGFGGDLTVKAVTPKGHAEVKLKIQGTIPGATEVNAYLLTKPGSGGFDKILEHES